MSQDAFYRLGLRVLNRLPSEGTGRIVMVTSAREGEGKTFVARALARALAAQCSGPVALVDCTLDRQAASVPGWSDLVDTGQWQAQWGQTSSSQTPEVPSPALISAGTRMRAETLFRPEAVAQALDVLRQRFAMTVVDAPCLAACGALGRHTDGTLLVVNASITRREVVQGALAANPIPADRLMGAVLNQRPEYVPNWLYRRVL